MCGVASLQTSCTSPCEDVLRNDKIGDIWAADLVDMSSFSKQRLQVLVDSDWCLHQWIVPLKTKTAVPSRLWTDKGTEFYNHHVRRVLEANNVALYSTENEEKSSVVERWNRTMKRIMWKYFTANNTQKYMEALPNMVDKYNSTYHRSIKLTPSDTRNPSNYQHVYSALYVTVRKFTSPKFHVGDKVRITRKKGTFEKGFTPNWAVYH